MTDSGDIPSGVTIDVAEHDTLPDILARVRSARGQAVTLSIPEHSPVFLTATEFRTLRDVVETNNVQLVLDTEDPLRLQLASMFKLVDYARPKVEDDNGDTDREIESTPSFQGWRRARDRHTGKDQAPPSDDDEDPISVSRRRRKDLYEAGNRRRDPNVALSEDATFVSLNYLQEEPGARRAMLIGRIVGVAVVALLVLGFAGWFFMPGTTVEARLLQGQISTELLYSVTRPGTDGPPDAAFSVEATETSANVAFDIFVPATGLQSTPHETARGTVTLRNASTEAVTLPAGTELTTATGITFTTDAEAAVPAGSPDGSTIGETTVNVTATAPGGTGNLAVGALSGKVADQPVYFSNREQETTGGSDIEVAVVTEADIAAAEDQVANNLQRVVAEDWTTQLPEGQVIIGPSVVPGTPEYTIEHQPGDIADDVVLRGTVEATGYWYDEENVREQALGHYQTALAEEVPAGYEMLPDTVMLGEPVLVSQAPGTVEYTMTATASVRAAFSDDDRQRLQGDLSGRSEDDATGILQNVPAFESWSLQRSPGWWPGGLPRSAGRIEIIVEDQTPPPVAPATPAGAS